MVIAPVAHLFYLITAFCTSVAIAENFDPALADPGKNLTCLGDSYPLDLPIIGDFNPNLVTMQQLCAKPQYRGGQPGQHIGGWCDLIRLPRIPGWPVSDRLPSGMIAFDISAGAQINSLLANERVMLGCRYKCFCNDQLDNLQIQPLNNGSFSNVNHNVFNQWSYDLTLDDATDLTNRAQKVQPPRPGLNEGLQLIMNTQDVEVGDVLSSRFIALNPANDIVCMGDLPAFPLPLPYTDPSDPGAGYNFQDLQEMCANQLSGGSM